MSKKTTSLNDLAEFDRQATDFLISSGFLKDGKFTDKKDTKFSLAVKSVLKQYAKHYKTAQEDIDVINIQNALECEKTKELLRDEKGGYKYSKDGMLSRNKEMRELFSKQIEIDQRIVESASCPALNEHQVDAFSGYVIKEVKA